MNTHIIPDKPMSDNSCTAAIANACKSIGIRTTVQLHIIRVQGARTLDLEEVDWLNKRSLGNWSTNVCDNCYITKLSLLTIRVMASHGPRIEYCVLPRISVCGYGSHSH